MTAERFMIDDAGELIDLNNHKFVNYGEECCNLLNKLSEENMMLKGEVAHYKLILMSLEKEAKRLSQNR